MPRAVLVQKYSIRQNLCNVQSISAPLAAPQTSPSPCHVRTPGTQQAKIESICSWLRAADPPIVPRERVSQFHTFATAHLRSSLLYALLRLQTPRLGEQREPRLKHVYLNGPASHGAGDRTMQWVYLHRYFSAPVPRTQLYAGTAAGFPHVITISRHGKRLSKTGQKARLRREPRI